VEPGSRGRARELIGGGMLGGPLRKTLRVLAGLRGHRGGPRPRLWNGRGADR
jgi:hypothetical protein